MDRSEYIKYIRYTVGEYNSAKKNKLFSLLKNEGIITTEENNQTSFLNQDSIKVDKLDIYESILKAVNRSDKAIEVYEKLQFSEHYKYSAIFTSNNFEQITNVVEHIPNYRFSNDISLYDTLKNPQKLLMDNKIVIKFNKKYRAIHPQKGEEMFLDYPVLLVIHTKEELMEIRLDSISGVFVEKNVQSIYAEIIKELIDYMENNYNIELQPLDIRFIRGQIEKASNIRIIAQNMYMFEGSKAQLAVGNNTNYVMPFIGDLRELIRSNEIIFKDSKDILEKFIKEKEELAEYPWIQIEIFGDNKDQNIKEKIIFNYMNRGYCVIQHYNNSIVEGMERMNNVVKYIKEYIGEAKSEQ